MNRFHPNRAIDPADIAFDIDGVVADTMGLFLAIARDEFQIDHLSQSDITCYTLTECLTLDAAVIDAIVARILSGNYRVDLDPIDGAPDVLAKMVRRHSPILFVTARPYPGPIVSWLSAYLPSHSAQIVATGDFAGKADILKAHGVRYFVEDRLETCFDVADAGIIPILFRQPWNRRPHPFPEVGSWTELEAWMALE